MKAFEIKKNRHRPCRLLPAFLSHFGTIGLGKIYEIQKNVIFSESCRYMLNPAKQGDWNKLFGVCFGVLGIHRNSIRFGWRYNAELAMIEISSIIYCDGKVFRDKVTEIKIDEPAIFKISYVPQCLAGMTVTFSKNGRIIDSFSFDEFNNNWRFGCGLYFGGTSKATHDMVVYMENFKNK